MEEREWIKDRVRANWETKNEENYLLYHLLNAEVSGNEQ